MNPGPVRVMSLPIQAEAIDPRQPLDNHVALQVRLLIDGEIGHALFDLGSDLRTQVEGAVEDIASLNPALSMNV